MHGTIADPRWLDPTVDPNDRRPGTCYLGDPRVVNNSPIGWPGTARCAAGCHSGATTTPAPTELPVDPDRGAHPGHRQSRRRRLHTQPHPAAVRRHRSPGQGDARSRTPTTTPDPTSALPCRAAVGIITGGLDAMAFRGRCGDRRAGRSDSGIRPGGQEDRESTRRADGATGQTRRAGAGATRGSDPAPWTVSVSRRSVR